MSMKYFKGNDNHYYMKHTENTFIHIHEDLINIVTGDTLPFTQNNPLPTSKEVFTREYVKVLMKILPNLDNE